MSNRAERSHVKSRAYCFATAGNMSWTALVAAVFIVRSHARQRGGRTGTELSQFRHFGQDDRRSRRTDSRDRVESFGFGLQRLVLFDQPVDEFITLSDLLFQKSQQLPGLLLREGIRKATVLVGKL